MSSSLPPKRQCEYTLVSQLNHEDDDTLGQRLANFFGKRSDSNYFHSVGHIISVKTTHLCHCSDKAAIDNI